MLMAGETVRQGQTTEFLNNWRCEACVRGDRKCLIQESLEECLYCDFAKETCVFTRTITRNLPRKDYTWAELVGAGSSSQQSPTTQTSFSPSANFARPTSSRTVGEEQPDPPERRASAYRLPPLKRSSPPFQGHPNGSQHSHSLAPLNTILGPNPSSHGLPLLPGQPSIPITNPIDIARSNRLDRKRSLASPEQRSRSSLPVGHGKSISDTPINSSILLNTAGLSQKRRIPLEFISDPTKSSNENLEAKYLKRNGSLDASIRMRLGVPHNLEPCWRCRILKRDCDNGDPCEPCMRNNKTQDRPQCHRGSVKDWLPKLFAGASHGVLTTKRGDVAFGEALLEPGRQFLTKARGAQSSPDHGLVPLSSIFDDQENAINLKEIRKFLDWLESVCFQNKFSHFDSAFMALCTLMLAVRAFAESYRLSFHHNMRSPSPSTMPSEMVIQTAAYALEALFGLLKVASNGVTFDPGANIAKWAGAGLDPEDMIRQRRESLKETPEGEFYRATESSFFGPRSLQQSAEASPPSTRRARMRHLATFTTEARRQSIAPSQSNGGSVDYTAPFMQTNLPVVQYEPLPEMGEDVQYTSFEVPGDNPEPGPVTYFGDQLSQLDPLDALKCQICGNVSRNRSENNKHKLRHEKPFTCSMEGCNRISGFTTQNDLDRHIKSIHGVLYQGRTFQCAAPHCAKATKMWPRADNFRQHCQRLHKELDLNELMDKSLDRAMKTMEKTGAIPLQAAGLTPLQAAASGLGPAQIAEAAKAAIASKATASPTTSEAEKDES